MNDQQKGNRLAAVLAFVAAGLAWTAVAIGYSSDRTVNWSTAAAGLFCASMGFMMWKGAAPPKS